MSPLHALTAGTRNSFAFSRAALLPWKLHHGTLGVGHGLFHSAGNIECKLVHCLINTVSIVFLWAAFCSLQKLEITSAQEWKPNWRGTPFPWAKCRTHVQEIEYRNYCMEGC